MRFAPPRLVACSQSSSIHSSSPAATNLPVYSTGGLLGSAGIHGMLVYRLVGRCRLGARLPFSDAGRVAGWAESIGSVLFDPRLSA
jgi:presenilin-like A22 family membrane protease